MKTRPTQAEIRDHVRSRFFVIRQSGGTTTYYDALTHQADLQAHHIRGVCISMGTATLDEAKEIVAMTHFRPITKQRIYRPNEADVVVEHGLASCNLWRPSKIIPDVDADATPFTQHLLDALGNKADVEYLLDVLAWRYQNPRATSKPHIVVYGYSPKGGRGKSEFIKMIETVFGESTHKTINTAKGIGSMAQVELWSRSWFIIDEAQVPKGSAAYDTLKANTGKDVIDSDGKHTNFARWEIPAMLLMMSNRPPKFLEEFDRRFFVVEWGLDTVSDEDRAEYFTKYIGWLKNGGYEAIAGLLKARKITHNLFADAPMNAAKEKVLMSSADPITEELLEVLENTPDERLFRMDAFADLWKKHNVKSTAQPHKMTDAGMVKHGRMKVGDKQHTVWYREGDKIIISPQEPTRVEWDSGTKSAAATEVLNIHPILEY